MLRIISFFGKNEIMYDRLLNIDLASEHSAFIFGPRGTGKTTWIKQNFSKILYFDLLDDDQYTEFLARPTRLGDKIPDDYLDWVVIDEIQKIPSLLNEVHRLIENRKIKFILTGSSACRLRRKGVNLLAGRAIVYYLHPLTVVELGESFNLQHSLQFGHLPAVFSHKFPEKYLASYITTYLREEVLQEGLTRNIALFSRFLEVASFSQGEVINYTEIARETATNRHTIANFFDILEDLLIAHRLPVFTKKAKRNLSAHPKFYFFDVGVYRKIRPQGPLDSNAELDEPALETLFLQEVRALNDYNELNYQFYYWRTRNQLEVDFIAYGKRGLLAFEIKRKAHLTAKDFKGLAAFAEDYPMAKLYMLYGGTKTYFERNIKILPFHEALLNLTEILQD